MAVKGLIDGNFLPDFEQLLGHPLPNGLVVNGVPGWLHAANDKMERETYVKIMSQSFTIIEIDEAKNILVEIVHHKIVIEKVKNDKDLEIWTKGRNEPNKKDKIIGDIINIFARLDGYDMLPGFLMTSGFVKRAPELHDPDDNVENVSHKVKMLESVVVNLANKLSEETRILKEDSKAIRSEIKSLKPSFADMFKNRETVKPKAVIAVTDDGRERKRSRVQDDTHSPDVTLASDDVFNEEFQTQQRRGFLHSGGQREQQAGSDGRRDHHGRGTGSRGAGSQGGNGGQTRDRKQSWRQKLPNITGNSGFKGFAAPIDLFVFNVNNDVTEDAIKNHMKDSKGLEILEIVKVSHIEARTKSFRVKVKSEDYEKAMDSLTWPSRVRVRPYRHFKQRREQPGGQFADGPGQPSGAVGHEGQREDDSQA